MTDTLGDTAPREPLPTGPGRFPAPRLIVTANLALAGLLTVLSLAGLFGVTDPSAYIGTVLLVGSILPSNWLRLGRFSQERRMRALARLRKPLGISAGVWCAIMAFAAFEYRALRGRSMAGTWSHLGLVGAGTLVSVLIYVVF